MEITLRQHALTCSAEAVVHCAGVVDLTADKGITYNAHVVGTLNMLRSSLETGNVRAYVQTSSIAAVTSPHAAYPQTNIKGNYFLL